MELWFLAALGGAVLAGVSNFYFKVAASRGYDAELFSLYGGLISIVGVVATLQFIPQPFYIESIYVALVFTGGLVAALTGVGKVYALRYIDTTIYYPLFKLLAPALAIVFGVALLGENFSLAEWVGMVLGLLVPLMLINQSENGRQNNLKVGLLLVLITGALSALTALFNKVAVDALLPAVTALLYASLGVFVGTIFIMIWKTGANTLWHRVTTYSSPGLIVAAGARALLISVSLGCTLYAYGNGGTLAVVQTVHSFYILIPIVLAIIFYDEHWNLQKVVAITLSVAALALLG